MDDVFWVLVGLGCGALILASPVIALIAYVRARSIEPLAKRVQQLERDLRDLRASTSAKAGAAEPPAARAASPSAPPVAPPVQATVAAPPPAPPILAQPVVTRPVVQPPVVQPPVAEPRIAASTPTPVAPPATRPAPPPRETIDWERWIGVRGAALLGGLLLALAGLLFFQYSIQHGWITPALRCSLGALAGIAALVAAHVLRRRGYGITADAVTGAGATILYGAAWAARVLYELIPPPLAFAAMIAITVLCGWLAVRHASQTIAVFGLLGGFATPVLLGSSSDQPLGLFGYLLLLDLGLVAVGRKQRWPMIPLLATLATPLLLGLWVGARFDERHLLLVLGFCATTAVLFAVGGNAADARERRRWLASQTLAVCVPILFAIYFASRTQLEARLLPLASLVVALNLVALWTARRQREPRLVLAAALGGAAMLTTWTLSSQVNLAHAWQLAGACCALALIAHAGLELASRAEDGTRAPATASSAGAALAMFVVIAVGAVGAATTPLWPWLVAALAVASLLARQAAIGTVPSVAIAGHVAAALVALGWIGARRGDAFPALAESSEFAVLAGVTAFGLVLAYLQRSDRPRAAGLRGVCAVSTLILLERALFSVDGRWSPAFVVATTAVVALLGWLASRSLRSGIAYACVGFACWVAQTRLGFELHSATPGARAALAWIAGTWIAAAAWPALGRFERSAWGWRAAATLCALWFVPVAVLVDALAMRAPDSASLIAGFLIAAALAFVVHAHARERDERGKSSALATGFAWFACVAIAYASSAFAVEVGHGIGVVGVALLAAGLALLGRRLPSNGITVLALLACVGVAIAAPSEVLWTALDAAHESRSGWPVLHWLSYSTGTAALAVFVVARQLRERPAAPAWLASARSCVALLAVLATFLWLNVEVTNLFSHGSNYDFSIARMPARDTAMSAAWAVFALVLLVLAVKLDRSALRWTSLAFFLATIAKAFLYDLGALRGLYRVGSLIGLALALIAVSLLYQRFVFRTRAPAPATAE